MIIKRALSSFKKNIYNVLNFKCASNIHIQEGGGAGRVEFYYKIALCACVILIKVRFIFQLFSHQFPILFFYLNLVEMQCYQPPQPRLLVQLDFPTNCRRLPF